MRRALIILCILVIATVCPRISFAQGDTDCLTTLSNAESEFASGRFIGIPEMLKECLDRNRFSNEEKVRVYMLLTQVYLLTDNPEAADLAYLNLLKANPEYLPSDLDPIEIIYLSKKFTSTPIFTPHLEGGVNISSQTVLYNENVVATPETTSISRRPLPGFLLGGGVEWNMTDNVSLGISGYFSQKNFRTTIRDLFLHDEQTTTEHQSWIDIPVYARYGKNVGKIRPFAYAGVAANLLIRTTAQEIFNDNQLGEIDPITGVGSAGTQTTTEGPARNIQFKRNMFNYSLVFGAGTRIKIGQDFLVVDARYMPGMTSVTNLKNNFYSSRNSSEMDPAIAQYVSIGDVFRVNNISLSIGYVKPLYNPRKATRVKTKGVSRRILRDESNDK